MSIKPYNQEASKKKQVEEMFDNIAFKYDFLNHTLSGGVDFWWRKKAINLFGKRLIKNDKKLLRLLDVATGTGDLAWALSVLNPKEVVGLDLSQEMLNRACEKYLNKAPFEISFVKGDSEKMDFQNDVFDGICVAFGVRNFETLEKGLGEMLRVLNKKGVLMILEFSTPENRLFNALYSFYLKNILPIIGRVLSKDPRAYKYLQESVQAFPSGKRMVAILEKVGLREVRYFPLTLGICTVYIAEK